MVTDIRMYFENAQLSLAAYSTLTSQMNADTEAYERALVAGGMSLSQAEHFAADYAIVAPTYTDSTGSAVNVFRHNETGEIVLAIRGTEPGVGFLRDFIEDVQLASGGLARSQIVSLYNYVQRLIVPGGQSAVQVEDVTPDIDPITGHVNDPGGIRETDAVAGLGYLAGIAGLTVTGHSLGGHLAAAMSRLFASLVTDTYTYNAPGFNLSVADGLLDQFPTDAGAFPSNITNVVANTGVTVIPTVGDLPGVPRNIYIEDQGLLAIPGNHGIAPLTDALAVYNLFATLDPPLNANPQAGVQKITAILKAASSKDSKSLESALDALRTLFQENFALGTPDANAVPTTINDRDNFYTNLFSLQGYLENLPTYDNNTKSLGLSVDSLVGQGTTSLFDTAQTDIATRYALYKLNPFVVNNASALYSTINTDGSLDLYVSSTRTGSLTDEYLKDRASFLYNRIQANNKDNDIVADATTLATTWVAYTGSPQYFEDNGNYLPYKLYLGPDQSIVSQPLNGMSQVKFGGSSTDTLTGGEKWDKLYGMDGADTLTGAKGNDYLEGGQGTDTYLYTAGDGLDTILDTDGLGQITFDGVDLNGGDKLFGETYRSTDGNYLYTLLHNTGQQDSLLISAMGGQIVVRDFWDETTTVPLREAA